MKIVNVTLDEVKQKLKSRKGLKGQQKLNEVYLFFYPMRDDIKSKVSCFVLNTDLYDSYSAFVQWFKAKQDADTLYVVGKLNKKIVEFYTLIKDIYSTLNELTIQSIGGYIDYYASISKPLDKIK